MLQDEGLMTVKEAAAYLKVSRQTVLAWLHSGKLQGVRLGGTRVGWRIPEGELRRLLGRDQASA